MEIITPEGLSWNPYCESYADNENAMTNAIGELLPSEYIHHKLIKEEDYPSIDAVFGLESINQYDDIVIVSAMRAVEEGSPPLNCYNAAISAVSTDAVKLNSIDKEYVYKSMPTQQDQVSALLSAISTALDLFTFANKLMRWFLPTIYLKLGVLMRIRPNGQLM